MLRNKGCSSEFANYLLEIAISYVEADSIHFGDKQSEFVYAQGGPGTVRRESRTLAMESIYVHYTPRNGVG